MKSSAIVQLRDQPAAALALAAATAPAQPYPARPVTVITSGVPFGLTDISARLVALKVTDTLGQPG